MLDVYDQAISLSTTQKENLLRRYGSRSTIEGLSYGTVEDFCDSWDHLLPLANLQGDLKDLQRPAALKLLLRALPSGANLLEIGAGEPHIANFLSELGYNVVIVDPYDGSGNGPTEFEYYVRKYPRLQIVRKVFSENLSEIGVGKLDCVYSVSVLEHVPERVLSHIFGGIKRFLKPGGYSIHLIDHVLSGDTAEHHQRHLAEILALQSELASEPRSQVAFDLASILEKLARNNDTYYLSAEGHNKWRGAVPYESFPFRKVVSIHSCKTYSCSAK